MKIWLSAVRKKTFFIVKKTKNASQQRWKLFYHFYLGVSLQKQDTALTDSMPFSKR